MGINWLNNLNFGSYENLNMWTEKHITLLMILTVPISTGATIIGWTVPNITASASGSGEIYVSEDAVKWLTIEDINAVSDTGAVHLRYTYVTQVFPIVVLTDGEFYLNDSLDYETTQSYTIVVTVEDMATPVGSGTATITVIVTDVNEATPQFGASEYSTCIEDGSEEGTTLTTVLATDQDTANTVTHGLTGGNTNLDFKIDVNTGEIQVKAANLDSSVTASYNLVVEAADDGSPMLTGTTTVLVTVGDCSTATTIAVSGMAIFVSMIVSVH